MFGLIIESVKKGSEMSNESGIGGQSSAFSCIEN